jgi:hypothetical protein
MQSDDLPSNEQVNDAALLAIQALLGLVSRDVTAVAVRVEAERVELIFWALRDSPELREDAQEAVFELDAFFSAPRPLIEYAIEEGEPDPRSLGRNVRLIYWAKSREEQS